MPREIVWWPAKVLTSPTREVIEFGASLASLLAEMMEACKAADGVGIAANQIGEPLSVAWVGREDGSFFEIVNPRILETTGPVTLEEGCLSVPGEWEPCPRFHRVKVKYQDRTGAWHELEAEGRLAHVLQHEIDHLYGTVYVMRLSSLKREMIRKRLLKASRE